MKDFSESDIETAYETFSADLKPNGGFGFQSNGISCDYGMTHRLIWYWPIGQDLWAGTNVREKHPFGGIK